MIIETERLILRPFCEDDTADVYEYLHAPMPHCFACMKLNSPEEAKTAVKERAGKTEYCFAITIRDTGKVIGEIEAYPEAGELHTDEDTPCDTFSPCWMLNPAYHGKGYAYEAARAFFDSLFRRKGVRRIYAYTEENNLRSRHLCEKLGMRREGLFREFVSFVRDSRGNPVYENTVQYAILKSEWEEKHPRHPEAPVTEPVQEAKTQITCRCMTLNDYDQVYALWRSCGGIGLNDVDDSREGIARFLSRNPTTCFVAVCGTRIVGTILSGHDGRRGHIYHLAVNPEYRNSGIGCQLVEKSKQTLRDCGIAKVSLVAFADNAAGNAFWEKMGFSRRDDLVYRNTELTAVKSLSIRGSLVENKPS